MNAPNTDRMLAVAPALAARLALSELSPLVVAAAAGLSEADFHASFGTLTDYVVRLQRDFMLEIRSRLIRDTATTAPGQPRLRQGGLIFLDCCINQRPLREWFLQGRTQTPAVLDGLRKLNQTYALILATDFKQEGWPHPEAGARLFISVLQELALIEHAAQGPSADARTVMWEFLQTYSPGHSP